MRISEHILHFIWRYRLFNPFDLHGSNGERIEVVQPGNYNTDAGPDFLFAHLRINNQEWHGHIEIHVDPNDWNQHGHQKNKAYNAVILHVVWDGHLDCFLEDGTLIPCLELKPLVDEALLQKIEQLLQNNHWLPCSYGMGKVPDYQKIQVLNRMGIERLEHRYKIVVLMLNSYRGDWERVCLGMLAGAFGMKVNKQSFQDLSQILSLKLIQKMKNNPENIHALFFGQAGFLKCYKGDDPYVMKLQANYDYLKKSQQLIEISAFQWKFMRMRPYNFPTIKLAQLASMYCLFASWFSLIVEANSLEELKTYCQQLEIPEFWNTHFHLEKESVRHNTRIIEQFFHLLAINSFVPILFSYGKFIGNQVYMDRALQWLEQLKPEVNSVCRRYMGFGMDLFNALETQAVLHLRSAYCNSKRCLECGIGVSIIRRD